MSSPDRTQDSPEKILEDIAKLSPPDQLRLAAEMLECKRPRLALAIAKRVATDLEILHLRGLF
jgi:hypothetical protein